MAKFDIPAGTTSNIWLVFGLDSTASDGSGKTGLSHSTSGLTIFYKRNTASADVSVTPAAITTLGTYASGGFREVDATGMPGVYEFHPPDAALAAGAQSAAFLILAPGMAPLPFEIQIT